MPIVCVRASHSLDATLCMCVRACVRVYTFEFVMDGFELSTVQNSNIIHQYSDGEREKSSTNAVHATTQRLNTDRHMHMHTHNRSSVCSDARCYLSIFVCVCAELFYTRYTTGFWH